MINVLFLSTSDSLGGAAKATLKLFKALQKQSFPVRMIVKKRISRQAAVSRLFTFLPMTVHVVWDNFILNRYSTRKRNYWTLGVLPNWNLRFFLLIIRYDIVQLNWVGAGFVPVALLRHIRKPIVWRLSDSWPFTGGCHIPEGCLKYTTGCGSCPQLDSNNERDISWRTIQRKQKNWAKLNLTIVAPSKWMAENAKRSTLFRNRRVVHIPTGVHTEVFKPLNRDETRRNLGVEVKEDIILFGAFAATTDPNKGFHLLLKALEKLQSMHPNPERITLAVFGNDREISANSFGVKATFLGVISDAEKLNGYYNAADVYVLPSLMENSPNTVLESLSAGTPVVAFNACGTTEMIDHRQDGYLAQAYDADDLAAGILYFLERKTNASEVRNTARMKVITKYDIDEVAKQYAGLYQSLISETT